MCQAMFSQPPGIESTELGKSAAKGGPCLHLPGRERHIENSVQFSGIRKRLGGRMSGCSSAIRKCPNPQQMTEFYSFLILFLATSPSRKRSD
jgi:hypothetical protein